MTKQLEMIAVALLSILSATAYDFEVDGIYYNVLSASDLTCEVAANPETYSGDIVIPSSVEFKNKIFTVTRIEDEGFSNCIGLTSIVIPNSVTEIGTWAFYNCSSLTSIVIPNSVTEIGSRAFYNCSSLTSIEIPESVEEIGNAAFYKCSSLESLTIPSSVTRGSWRMLSLSGCDKLKSLYFLPSNDLDRYGIDSAIYFPPSLEYIYWNSHTFPSIMKGGADSCSFTASKSCTGIGRTFDKLTIEYSAERLEINSWSDYPLDYLSYDRENTTDYSGRYVSFYPKQLVLGRHIIDCTNNIKTDEIVYLESNAIVPPIIPAFNQMQYIDLEPVVPAEAIDAYREAPVWKEFWNLRPMANVDEISSPSKHEIGRYDLQGRKIDDDYSGIAIVRYSDGSTKKIVAKP